MAIQLRKKIKELRKERNRYKYAYNTLMDCWHELCNDTQVHVDKKLKRVNL
jgi:hypothetical protein